MGIYNLSNAHYLQYDLEKLFAEFDELYDLELTLDSNLAKSKIFLPKSTFWASPEAHSFFNKLIPKIKSLHKDMYGIVEAIIREKDGKFEPMKLQDRFKYFRQFRLLNNQFKHFEVREAQIDVNAMIINIGHEPQIVEVICQFKYADGKIENFSWSIFILLFLLILESYRVIIINRE